jgi:hypothetical protein
MDGGSFDAKHLSYLGWGVWFFDGVHSIAFRVVVSCADPCIKHFSSTSQICWWLKHQRALWYSRNLLLLHCYSYIPRVGTSPITSTFTFNFINF